MMNKIQKYRNTCNKIYIIGGKWKKTPLPILNTIELRPTLNRVRETLFNWLKSLIDNWKNIHCLDMFAGSGALGYEAASRGAHVTMLEYHKSLFYQLQLIKKKLNATQVHILYCDAKKSLKKLDHIPTQRNTFDLIFIDPPFYHDWLSKIIPLCELLLTQDGLLYVEIEYSLINQKLPKWMEHWQIIKSNQAGLVFYYLLQKMKTTL